MQRSSEIKYLNGIYSEGKKKKKYEINCIVSCFKPQSMLHIYQTLGQIPQGESLSLEVFKRHIVMVLGDMVW